jgi:hypothetical protein
LPAFRFKSGFVLFYLILDRFAIGGSLFKGQVSEVARIYNFVAVYIENDIFDDAKTWFKPILTTKAVSATDPVYQTVAGANGRIGE